MLILLNSLNTSQILKIFLSYSGLIFPYFLFSFFLIAQDTWNNWRSSCLHLPNAELQVGTVCLALTFLVVCSKAEESPHGRNPFCLICAYTCHLCLVLSLARFPNTRSETFIPMLPPEFQCFHCILPMIHFDLILACDKLRVPPHSFAEYSIAPAPLCERPSMLSLLHCLHTLGENQPMKLEVEHLWWDACSRPWVQSQPIKKKKKRKNSSKI